MNKFTVIAKKASFWEVVDGKQKRISKARFDAILTQKIAKVEYRETETVYHVEEVELSKANTIIAENRYKLVDDGGWYQTLELLGFSNINSRFGGQGISFTAEWDARNVVNNPAMWKSPRAYEYFAPFMDVLSKLGGKAKIYRVAERCYINADNAVSWAVLEVLYDDCCRKYYNNLRDEYNYLISDVALKDYFLNGGK